MITKQEIQGQIRECTRYITKLATAVAKLPDSATRRAMIERHDKAFGKLASLEVQFDVFGMQACYFGYTDDCPGCVCDDCGYQKNMGGIT